jgi:hypothetical protein
MKRVKKRTFKVTVVERNTDSVETKALEERGIRIGKEVLQELDHNEISESKQTREIPTLSKKRACFFSPMASLRASRIWCSQPG